MEENHQVRTTASLRCVTSARLDTVDLLIKFLFRFPSECSITATTSGGILNTEPFVARARLSAKFPCNIGDGGVLVAEHVEAERVPERLYAVLLFPAAKVIVVWDRRVVG